MTPAAGSNERARQARGSRRISDAAMMGRALREAARAGGIGEVPIGAAIYRGDELIAAAGNRREHNDDPTGHAEMIAIRQAAAVIGDWRLNDCTLVVTLEPCPMCAGAIVNARIGRLVYGAADPKMGAVRTLYRICDDARLNHRLPIRSGVLAEQCATMLRDFFRGRRGQSVHRQGAQSADGHGGSSDSCLAPPRLADTRTSHRARRR